MNGLQKHNFKNPKKQQIGPPSAAKDILAGMMSNPEKISIRGERLATIEGSVNAAIEITDELIKQLKEK